MGLALARSHRRSWIRQQGDPSLTDYEREFYRRRYRRRIQVASMLAMLGVLIGAGDLTMPLQRPFWATLYWIGVLLLTGWVMLQGFWDLWSTAAYTGAELNRIRQKRRELEQQLVEFKHRNLGERGFDEQG